MSAPRSRPTLESRLKTALLAAGTLGVGCVVVLVVLWVLAMLAVLVYALVSWPAPR